MMAQVYGEEIVYRTIQLGETLTETFTVKYDLKITDESVVNVVYSGYDSQYYNHSYHYTHYYKFIGFKLGIATVRLGYLRDDGTFYTYYTYIITVVSVKRIPLFYRPLPSPPKGGKWSPLMAKEFHILLLGGREGLRLNKNSTSASLLHHR